MFNSLNAKVAIIQKGFYIMAALTFNELRAQNCCKKRLKPKTFSGSYQRNRIPSAKRLTQTQTPTQSKPTDIVFFTKIEDHNYVL